MRHGGRGKNKMLTKERAKEILKNRNDQGDSMRTQMTPEEFKYSMDVWDSMDGETNFHDAVLRISKGESV
jgi:hypothetical protein